MRPSAHLVSSAIVCGLLLSGCGHRSYVAEGGGSGGIYSGGSGGVGSGTSGGTTSGGTTSGGTTSGGTTSGGTSGGVGGSGGTGSGGGSGGSGGSGSSGGSGGVVPVPPGLGGVTPSGNSSLRLPLHPFQGIVNGGESRAVVGAHVYVLEPAAAFGQPSVSLLTAATGHRDSLGNYALTGEYGGFSIDGDYACTPGHPVYLLVRGGASGDTSANSAIGLMASLGACPAGGSFTRTRPFIFVNEVTTVAAAWALAANATDAAHVSGADSSSLHASMARAASLVNVSSGFANSRAAFEPSRRMVHTLANILAACINSAGPASSSCTTLFANARSRGASGTVPADTATAALNIARNPAANVLALYDLQPIAAPPFLPAFDSPPPDFTLAPVPAPTNTIAALHP